MRPVAQSVAVGGLASHLVRLGREGGVPVAELSVNRRQVDPPTPTRWPSLPRLRALAHEAVHALRFFAGLIFGALAFRWQAAPGNASGPSGSLGNGP